MSQQPAKPISPEPDAGHVPLSEEMDRAKWTLPPVLPVIAAAVVIAIVVGIYTYHTSQPLAEGKILGVFPVEQTSKSSVIVGVQLSLQGESHQRLVVHGAKVQVMPTGSTPDTKPLEDDAAPAVDFERYFRAYPELAQHKMEPLRPETELLPGQTKEGMVIVAFPMTKEAFGKRQSLRVIVEIYDHPPIIIQQ